MPYTPTVRRPTGVPAAPLIMVSGPPKSGKSLASYALGMSDRIANTWVVDLGEGSGDEYGDLGCYDLLDWGRTFRDLQDTVRWAIDQPVPEGQLNALIIDSGTELWDSLKLRADKRARSSRKNAEALRKDPDFEVDVSMPYWNDAKEAWARIISPMRLAGHLVGVVCVRTDIVAEVVNGAPTNRRVSSYQCEKTLPAVVTAHVAVDDAHVARLVEVRSRLVQLPTGGLVLDQPNPLGHVLDLMVPVGIAPQSPAVHHPIDEDRLLDAAQRQMIIDLVLSVREEGMRKAVKARLAAEYGLTTEITRDQFDACVLWLTRLIDAVQGPVEEPELDPEQPSLADVAGQVLADGTPMEVEVKTTTTSRRRTGGKAKPADAPAEQPDPVFEGEPDPDGYTQDDTHFGEGGY